MISPEKGRALRRKLSYDAFEIYVNPYGEREIEEGKRN